MDIWDYELSESKFSWRFISFRRFA